MIVADVRRMIASNATTDVGRWRALAGTLALRRKVDASLRTVEAWRMTCRTPVVSVSGGKDSCVLLQLCREVDPDIPVIHAMGPVPYSDTASHLQLLRMAAGGTWMDSSYTYDVAGVLAGDVRYPSGLKQRTLRAAIAASAIDGVALGLRAQESRGRLWHVRLRGQRYESHGLQMCMPIVYWTAEEVIGWLMATDALPLHPVYTRTYLMPDVNRLRDGTWLPNQMGDGLSSQRTWIAWHYPEHLECYDRAVAIFSTERR